MLSYDKKIGEGSDDMWSTVILVLPQSSVFYMAQHGYGSFSLKPGEAALKNGFRCLPTSWLRIHRLLGQPAKGGFIKFVMKCYPVYYTCSMKRTIIQCYQFDDYESGTPLLPPDIISGATNLPPHTGRQAYNLQMKNSPSFRYGCRRYVKAALYQNIPVGSFILDVREMGDVKLAVTIRDCFGRPTDVSHVQVANLSSEKDALDKLLLGSNILKSRPGNARQHTGDMGKCLL